MSNEPMPSEPIASRGMTGEPAADETAAQVQAESNVDADAALVVAAVARMQAADHEARQTLARLRNGLSAMSEAIDRAKAQNAAAAAAGHEDLAKVVDIAAMLDEFEHLVDGLVEVATGREDEAPAAPVDIAHRAIELVQSRQEAAAPDVEAVSPSPVDLDQVPTVSGVVSRLDPEQPLELAEAEAREPAFTYASAPSVEMLKSLVEALNASIPDETPEAEALAETPGYRATAKIMAQDVIQAFAWELTRRDEKETPEAAAETAVVETNEAAHAAAVETTAEETSEAPQVAVAMVPEQFAELAEIAPVEQTAPEAVAAPTAEAVQGIEALATEAQVAEAEVTKVQVTEVQVTEQATETPHAFEAPQETLMAQDLEQPLTEATAPAFSQPEVAQAVEPESAETEPLVFDVVVEFDPVEPRPASQAETIEASAELAEVDAPIPVAESTETLVHATTESDNDIYILSANEAILIETQASGAEEATVETAAPETIASDALAEDATAASAPEAFIETVEPALDSVEAPAEIVQAETGQPIAEIEVAPEAAEPIHTEATAEAVADIVAVESPQAAHAEAAPVEDVAPVETTSADAALAEAAVLENPPIEYTLADLPAMPHEASLDELVAEQPVAEAEHPFAAAVVETIAEPMPVAEAAPAIPIAVAASPAAAAPVAADDVVVYEVELMARLEQMEALPLLPQELGTAVIFGRRNTLPAIDLNIAPETEPAPTAEAVAEPAAVHDPVAEVTAEPVAEIVAEPAAEVVAEAVPEVAPETAPAAEIADPLPEATIAAPEVLPTATAEPTASEPVTAEATPQPATGQAKLVDLEAVADSDDFLFEPAGSASTNGAKAAPSEPAAATPPPAERAAAAAPAQRPPPADPLIPIKAMSVEERIALFT
jgi:hypothetical protein